MREKIKNYCIIAHIDHWKSTLADRMLEITWTIRKEKWKSQVLDKMDLEQERWITIKLTPARMQWKDYQFNLIDTPWHVDFQYEVSRSLAAVEWAILLVDASQWIQAQTLSTLYMAMEQWLEIIPVLNKIDLPAADPVRVSKEIEHLIWIDSNEVLKVSAKTWENVDQVLDAIIEKIESPEKFKLEHEKKFYPTEISTKNRENISKALIFDSVYDKYRGVVVYVKIVDWSFKIWDKLSLIHSQIEITPTEVWFFNPDYHKSDSLQTGEIWYIVTWQKSVRDAKIWDTIVKISDMKGLFSEELDYIFQKQFVVPWFKKITPFVYAWVYPIDTEDYKKLKNWFEKLTLNDSSVTYDYENSKALGHWFRSWFLWTLHMDIIKERLSREFDIETIFTTPNVIYLVKLKDLTLEKVKTGFNVIELVKTWLYKEILNILEITKNSEEDKDLKDENLIEKYTDYLKNRLVVRSWADMPDSWQVDEIYEPYSEVEIVWPNEFSGNIMELLQEYRWELIWMEYIDNIRVLRKYLMPLWEIIVDFYDRLKSSTKWYATMNYEFKKYKHSLLSKLDIYINSEKVWAFAMIVHKDKAYYTGRNIVQKLKTLIPKHLFAVPLQAGVWNKMIARETIPAIRKDVIAKCYGWDVSRKKKLLAKQKEWKKRMKSMWKVSVPNDIFIKMVTR